MKYVLKICGTTVLLTPLLYIVLICLLAILPGYQIPDLIGFIYIIYVLPYTALFTIITAVILFLFSVITFNLMSKRSIKIVLSVLSAVIVFSGFMVLFFSNPLELYTDNYYLPTLITALLIFFIWFYEFKSPVRAVVSTTPHTEL